MKAIAVRLALAQAATGLIGGATAPFFPAWLAAQGLSASEIGVLLAAGRFLLVVVGPLSGLIADARNDRRAMMLVLYAAMLSSYAVLDFTTSTAIIFAATIAASLSGGASWPLLESVSVRLSERHHYDYGHVRVWGSAVFVAANIVSGLVKSVFGIQMLPAWLIVAAALNLLAVFLLPSPPPGAAMSGLASRLRATFAEAHELMRSLPFLLFLGAASFAQGSHAFYYTYGGLHWLNLGYSGWLVGAIWPLGILAEIGLMSFSLPVFRYLGSTKLLLFAAAACVIRWSLLAFDPPLPIVIAAQFLHGATFAMAHLGAMYFVLKAVPPRLAATAQSLYAVCASGIVMGAATFASGPLYGSFGGRGYLLMSLMGLAAMVFAWLLGRIWNGERLTQAGTEEHVDTI